ncbi:flagellar motor switch protein FliN [Botrimarina hoheduenensis]|uniref:Flagellar motor switch protein FliN n=1 Tax=Botrimarina hoheduenensis TaxID=2528000 RepID=A0A5C5VZ03_9BACT|nr:flagellar motor switch protein FliN [Botrimarina hoheduenensis]TWT43193.1 Flagellar motor switch protein FliN [Botrimarina hoheduenensis]
MSDGSDQVDQDEIEKLLAMSRGGTDSAPAEAPKPSASGGSAGDDHSLQQDEIEALMGGGSTATATSTAASPVAAAVTEASGNDIELLLDRAEQAIASIDSPINDLPEGVAPFRLETFGGSIANEDGATLDLVRDVQLDLRIELGRTRMPLEDVLRLRREAVVALDKLAGDPVDVYANGRLIARGEVLVLNDNFCVRVTELIVGDAAVA